MATTVSDADIANRRILRLAFGTSMAMAFSQIISWPLSYMTAVVTMFLLATPLFPPTWRNAVKVVAALVVPCYLGILLLPLLMYARWTGVILIILCLFGSFYYSARGGSPIMSMFMTIAITLVVTVGSVSAKAMVMVVDGVTICAVAGMSFFIFAHALLPDYPASTGPGAKPPPAPPKPSRRDAQRNAFRSLAVMLPLVMIFLFIDSSTSYVVIMIKVASMGQQANAEVSRAMGRQQLQSTLWGGIGAILGYLVVNIWPSLLMFCLLIAIGALVYGRGIFQGRTMHPNQAVWSYALLTMIIILTPAVANGGDVTSAFWSRLMLFVVIALYGTIAVAVFDTFWHKKKTKAENTGATDKNQPDLTPGDA